MIIELSDDEMNTLREAFDDVGCDCPSVDWDKFKALGVKLGFWEAEKPPTEEELKRREEYRNSPAAKMIVELMRFTNNKLIENMKFYEPVHIKLPNDYNIKDKE